MKTPLPKHAACFFGLLALILTNSCNKGVYNRQTLEQPLLKVGTAKDTMYFSWNKVPQANQYLAFYRNAKITAPHLIGSTATNLSDSTGYATYFYPATKYRAYVFAYDTVTQHCSPQNSLVEFTTPCIPLVSFNVYDRTRTTAKVFWGSSVENDVSDISSFALYVRKKNDSSFDTFVTDYHNFLIDGLEPATEYEVKISFLCTDGVNYATPWRTFMTLM